MLVLVESGIGNIELLTSFCELKRLPHENEPVENCGGNDEGIISWNGKALHSFLVEISGR